MSVRRKSIRRNTLVVFVSAVAAGAVIYGAAIAYPVERSGEPVVVELTTDPSIGSEVAALTPRPARFVSVDSVTDMRRRFEAFDFALAPVRRGNEDVPRLMLANLPDDYPGVEQVDLRKRLFFKTILPLVLRVNEEILADRHRLVSLIARMESGLELEPRDRTWLENLADRYRTNPGEFATLLRRVDAVSPALAIAQSVEESGWGRSRFVRQGNALFGQRIWSEGAGMVPEERAAGEDFEIRAFPGLIDSVRAYALNLNRHHAYADYRIARARLRATEVALDPYALADTLVEYSERRESYVDTLKSILRANRLEQFEMARLQRGTPVDTLARR